MKPYEPENLPPPGIDWTEFVSLIGQSNAALARYDGILQGIVNPRILLSPLTTQEAVLSSRIEGTQATLEEVMEFEADPKEEIPASKYADIQESINYTRLNAVSKERDWNRWISFFLRAVIHQARSNSGKAREILALYERMKREAPEITHSQFVIQTIDALFDRPVFQSGDFILRSGIGRVSASRILGALKNAGVITTIREARGRQGAVYVFGELLRITENPD